MGDRERERGRENERGKEKERVKERERLERERKRERENALRKYFLLSFVLYKSLQNLILLINFSQVLLFRACMCVCDTLSLSLSGDHLNT